jgi:general secretion pathway protein D
MDVEAEFKVLTGSSVNGIPVIGNRSVKSGIRMKMGEWAMVAGLLDTNEARTVAGLAGMSQVPYLGALTSTHEHDHSTDEVLLIMRPRLITLPPGEFLTRTYGLGTETRPTTPL